MDTDLKNEIWDIFGKMKSQDMTEFMEGFLGDDFMYESFKNFLKDEDDNYIWEILMELHKLGRLSPLLQEMVNKKITQEIVII